MSFSGEHTICQSHIAMPALPMVGPIRPAGAARRSNLVPNVPTEQSGEKNQRTTRECRMKGGRVLSKVQW